MKTVILCGGRGTRLGEHGRSVPKALIRIGGKPIIWHLMTHFSSYGFDRFVLCLGFLGDQLREYFDTCGDEFEIEFVDTGLETNTGGRLRKVRPLLEAEPNFCVTYGDGLSDVDISGLVKFHLDHGKVATVTAVHPFSNFGLMDVAEDGTVERFREKPKLNEWVNGGFFVFKNGIFESLDDNCVLEQRPFEILASRGEMRAFRHEGFWKCMDTFKDSLEFEELWAGGAPWTAAQPGRAAR